jgi:hypothetical protein
VVGCHERAQGSSDRCVAVYRAGRFRLRRGFDPGGASALDGSTHAGLGTLWLQQAGALVTAFCTSIVGTSAALGALAGLVVARGGALSAPCASYGSSVGVFAISSALIRPDGVLVSVGRGNGRRDGAYGHF